MTAPGSQVERVLLCVSQDDSVLDDARFAFPSDVRVECAADGREGWDALQRFTPEAVIVDIQAGSAGGFNLARDMSQDDRLKHVPVLMLLQRREDAWLAKQGSADSFLVKPVIADVLVREALALID